MDGGDGYSYDNSKEKGDQNTRGQQQGPHEQHHGAKPCKEYEQAMELHGKECVDGRRFATMLETNADYNRSDY